MPITPQQRTAAQQVQHTAAHDTNQQIRLVAGPGTGKSFVIEERVAWLINNGVNSNNIFVVSFTKAASDDLRRRILSHCTNQNITTNQLSVTTLHSLALRVLRAASLLSRYPADPLVMDSWELENIFDAEFSAIHHISSRRSREIRTNHEAFWSTSSWHPPNYIPPNPPISTLERRRFDQFHTPRAHIYSCVLPGEIIRQCNESITSGNLNPAALIHINHLIIDEYQDLNPCDLEFIDHLTNAGVIAFIAGDDDQSIYSFRFASPMGIQQFPNKYPGSSNHALQDCFRCTNEIVHTANSLITTNAMPSRIPKTLNSLYANSNPILQGHVFRWRFPSGVAESRAIAESCRDLIQAGVTPKDILILLSNTRVLQSDISHKLDEVDIPYEVSGNNDYINSEEFRFILACFRIVNDQDDYVAHRTVLGLIQRVGIQTCNNIADSVIQNNLTFKQVCYTNLYDSIFTTRALSALNSARTIFAIINTWQPTDTLSLRGSEIETLIRNQFGTTGVQNWNRIISNITTDITLKELRDFLWTENKEQKENIMKEVLDRIGTPNPHGTVIPDRIRIMTMHGSKGLSSPIVFIPGLEDEILPGPHRNAYTGLVLESARLLYMSITRAKIACVLSYASRRTVHGSSLRHSASRFNNNLSGAFIYRQSGGLTTQEVSSIVQDIPHL